MMPRPSVSSGSKPLSELRVVVQDTVLKVGDTGAKLKVDTNVLKLLVGAEQGPVGPAGAVDDYIHTQSSPATTWIINHNLGRKPDVTLLSVGDQEFEGVITHTNANQAVVSVTTATAGTARCI